MSVEGEDWVNAAIRASNLTQLELLLGEMGLAAADAEQAVTYAERSGDAFQRMGRRTIYADALHQAGRRDEAEARFREAEELQAERQPDYPLLYSVQGSYIAICCSPPPRAPPGGACSIHPASRNLHPCRNPAAPSPSERRGRSSGMRCISKIS
jgi:hypothetical protein